MSKKLPGKTGALDILFAFDTAKNLAEGFVTKPVVVKDVKQTSKNYVETLNQDVSKF